MRSVVLLSGGLDSAVSLAHALREGMVKLCLTMDYGQRAATREISAAAALADYYDIEHRVVELPFLREVTSTALVNRSTVVPEPVDEILDDPVHAKASAAAVWVPNRNGLFINIAASFAEAMNCQLVVTGFNKEEALSFPDNSAAFVSKVNDALAYSTANQVRVISYTQRLSKIEIVRLGQRLQVPWRLLWSCYYGGRTMCGNCESCRRFFRAMEAAGLAGY
ncbi:MAG TPA: 7-cyano-7-deazaguanine synthase QueC [Desulfotomaculum sp.]|jgi:7-cyano-7-deazaguanine synthase|nr:7-cyano-7-deazaguanine synthase QueC [Desulfotomaculum sp.]